MQTLMISEKPDAMRRIAEALADKGSLKKFESRDRVAWYEFVRKGKKHVVVCAVGHLFNLSPVKKGWTYPIFDAEWVPSFKVRKESAFSEKYYRVVESAGRGASDYIVCTDYDTEGSLIGNNVLQFIFSAKDGRRMKFSTLTKDELVDSYENASEHLDFNQIEMGLTRHKLDWLYGINITRALTLAMKAAADRGFAILSSGRVQSPTLAILYKKELEIGKFVPKPFWQLEAKARADKTELIAVYEKDRVWDEKEAKRVADSCKGKDGIVKKITKRKYKQKPPVPFNTTDLQSEAYSQFKYSPRQTMSIAETLYQAGYISYPRSSSQKLPPSIGYGKIIKALSALKEYSKFAQELLAKELRPNEGPREDPAHPAVYPTNEVPAKLSGQQKNIYDLIVRRFLAVFGEDATRESMAVDIDVNGNVFIASGHRTIEEGWTKFYAKYLAFEEQILPELKEGQRIEIIKIDVFAKETQPPGRFSQGSIVKEMEDRNLGTRATRAEILQTLYDRGYVIGKSIQVTKLGETVTKVLDEFCPRILSEKLSRHFEEEMELVYQGKKKREEVEQEAVKVLTRILKDFKKNEDKIGKSLLEGFVQARKEARVLGKCPNCSSELKIIYSRRTKKRFVGCSGYPKCHTAFPLPQFGSITALNKECPECKMPVIQVWRAGRRPFRMCINHKCKTKEDWGKKKPAKAEVPAKAEGKKEESPE